MSRFLRRFLLCCPRAPKEGKEDGPVLVKKKGRFNKFINFFRLSKVNQTSPLMDAEPVFDPSVSRVSSHKAQSTERPRGRSWELSDLKGRPTAPSPSDYSTSSGDRTQHTVIVVQAEVHVDAGPSIDQQAADIAQWIISTAVAELDENIPAEVTYNVVEDVPTEANEDTLQNNGTAIVQEAHTDGIAIMQEAHTDGIEDNQIGDVGDAPAEIFDEGIGDTPIEEIEDVQPWENTQANEIKDNNNKTGSIQDSSSEMMKDVLNEDMKNILLGDMVTTPA